MNVKTELKRVPFQDRADFIVKLAGWFLSGERETCLFYSVQEYDRLVNNGEDSDVVYQAALGISTLFLDPTSQWEVNFDVSVPRAARVKMARWKAHRASLQAGTGHLLTSNELETLKRGLFTAMVNGEIGASEWPSRLGAYLKDQVEPKGQAKPWRSESFPDGLPTTGSGLVYAEFAQNAIKLLKNHGVKIA